MKKSLLGLGLLVTTGLISGCLFAGSQKNTHANIAEALAAFPQAKKNETRWVINLPKRVDENTSKVELFVGQTLPVDCNAYHLTGTLHQKTVTGWGYTYFYYQSGDVVSTRMGCPDGSKHQAFVTAQPITVGYNSHLPMVIYTPKSIQVKYRILTAGKLQQANTH